MDVIPKFAFHTMMFWIVGSLPCIETMQKIQNLRPVSLFAIDVYPTITPAFQMVNQLQSIEPVFPGRLYAEDSTLSFPAF